MELVLIAAISKNYVIGKDNDIPWHIPDDLKRFKELTLSHPVIMGRKTYESIPKKFRPLSNRLNIILSRTRNYQQEGAYVYHYVDDVLDSLNRGKPYMDGINYDQIFVIGGQQIYDLTIKLADKLEITHVNKIINEGDAFFPTIDDFLWKEMARQENDGYAFVTYRRNY